MMVSYILCCTSQDFQKLYLIGQFLLGTERNLQHLKSTGQTDNKSEKTENYDWNVINDSKLLHKVQISSTTIRFPTGMPHLS